jgi:hypothetical protein
MKTCCKNAPHFIVSFLSFTIISCAAYPRKILRSRVGDVENIEKKTNGTNSNSENAESKVCQESSETSCGPFSVEEIGACRKFSPADATSQKVCDSAEWSKKFHNEITSYLLDKRKSSTLASNSSNQ